MARKGSPEGEYPEWVRKYFHLTGEAKVVEPWEIDSNGESMRFRNTGVDPWVRVLALMPVGGVDSIEHEFDPPAEIPNGASFEVRLQGGNGGRNAFAAVLVKWQRADGTTTSATYFR